LALVLNSKWKQVFPGFDPGNELFATRISLGTYLAAEKEVIDKIQLDIATRMEYYENYGASIIWNTGMKYQHNDKINIRLSANSGYRAPSMPQVHHQSESFQFRSVQGELIPERVQHIKDGSALAKLAHLDPLKPETSLSYNLGFDYSPNSSFSLEVDAYQVKIANRIVLSGVIPLSSTDQLYETFSSNDITSIQFLSNAIGTSTRGISFSSKYKYDLDRNKFVFQINGNLNKTRLNRTEEGAPVFSSSPLFQGLEHIVFDREEVARTENSSPDLKLLSSVNWVRPSYSLKLSGAYYGSVSYLHSKDGNPENWVTNARNGILESRDQRFAPKAVFDLSFDYALSDVTNVTVGVNNLFDTYPDEHTHSANVSYGNFKYSRRVSQFGVRGRYFFTSLSAKF